MQSYIRAEEIQETVVTNDQKPNKKAQVVVVGAGLAGLAAAQKLHEAGVEDVVILDAQERIGGRVHTINHSDYLLELGAQWLHGAEENPLYNWLAEKNMLDDFEDATAGFKGMFCTSKGQVIDQRLVDRVISIMVESKLSLSKNCSLSEEGGIASNVFKHSLESAIDSDDELKANRGLVFDIFNWFLRYETIDNCCDSMDEVSTASYTDWTDWGDGILLNFKHGYRSLLHWFCNHMPSKNWIHLNTEVTNIEILRPSLDSWLSKDHRRFDKPLAVKYKSSNFKLTESGNLPKVGKMDVVEVNNNSCDEAGLIECDHVIVTVSLGFLKQNHTTLFTPKLPHIKQELIDSIGFGTVNKIILQFEKPFWDKNHGIKLLWDSMVDKSHFPTWVEDIISFDVVRRQPNLLIGWIGGFGAKLMENESDDEVGDVCLRILDRFLPEDHVRPSRLINCVCSRWNSNPFTCGSYSFQSIKSFNLKVEKLNEPLYNVSSAGALVSSSTVRIPRVLFAGEATAGKLYSTTHGAIITGWREAERLREYMFTEKRKNIQPVIRQLQYDMSN